MEDRPEGLKTQHEQKPGSSPQASGHEENVDDAIEKAQESTDDRIVEAAAKKDGLRGALAARMDAMNGRSKKYADRWDTYAKSQSLNIVGMTNAAAAGLRWYPAKAVEMSSAFIRDRLQPKAARGQVVKSPSSGK